MKWLLRIFVFLHIGLFLFGLYSVLFREEYVFASKYILVGLTGFFLFLNAFLLVPLDSIYKKTLLVSTFVLYLVTVLGFLMPYLLKQYWNILLAGAVFVVLNSVFIRIIKQKRKWETVGFPLLSLLVIYPFLRSYSPDVIWLFSAILLGILSIYLLIKISKA